MSVKISFSIFKIAEFITKTFDYDRELLGSEDNRALMAMSDVRYVIDNLIRFDVSPSDGQKNRAFAVAFSACGYTVAFLNNPDDGITDAYISRQ
jgi:hypothetical protein